MATAPDPYAFNKAARNQAQNAAASAAPPSLNPPFPYTFLSFDPSLFGLPAAIVKIEQANQAPPIP